MCYQLIERYSVCGCLYYRHAVDPCHAYGRPGHPVVEKTVLVGYACERHSTRSSAGNGGYKDGYGGGGVAPDSGYGSRESWGRR